MALSNREIIYKIEHTISELKSLQIDILLPPIGSTEPNPVRDPPIEPRPEPTIPRPEPIPEPEPDPTEPRPIPSDPPIEPRPTPPPTSTKRSTTIVISPDGTSGQIARVLKNRSDIELVLKPGKYVGTFKLGNYTHNPT